MDENGSVTHSVTANHHYAYNGKLMLFSLFALVTISIIVALFHYYAVWAHQRRRNREFRHHRGTITITNNTSTPPPKEGLEPSVINSIASFSYDAASHDPPLECAVCLSEFVDNELGRFLPSCNHCFHIDCIDMWFYSRSNCPLCRAPVRPIENPVGNVTSAGETSGSGSGSGLSNVHLRVVDDNVGGSSSSLLRKPPELVGIIVEIPTMNPDFGDSDTTRQEQNQKSNSR